jgi:hypothetical protein
MKMNGWKDLAALCVAGVVTLATGHAEVAYSDAEAIALYDFAWKTCSPLAPEGVEAERSGMQARWTRAGLSPEVLDRIRASADYRKALATFSKTKEDVKAGCAATYGKSR